VTPHWLPGAAGGLGLIVGYGLNAVIYRTPRRERAQFSARYPVVEIATAILYAAFTVRFGVTAQLPAYLYLATVGVALTMIDLDVRRLPDSVILPSYAVSVVLLMPAGASTGDWYAGARALCGMAALLTLFFALALAYPNGLGFGEVKLAGLIGLYLGWLSWDALFVAAAGTLLMAVAGGTAALMLKHAPRAAGVPIAPCLVSAGVLAVFVTAPLSTWYASLLPA
jgi:leader peptidase (prepilin peptidase) / N-methyltransferase